MIQVCGFKKEIVYVLFFMIPYTICISSVDFDNGEIRMNKRTPGGVYNFQAKVHDFVVFTHINATATVKVVVQEITDDAVFSSGSLRFTGKYSL